MRDIIYGDNYPQVHPRADVDNTPSYYVDAPCASTRLHSWDRVRSPRKPDPDPKKRAKAKAARKARKKNRK